MPGKSGHTSIPLSLLLFVFYWLLPSTAISSPQLDISHDPVIVQHIPVEFTVVLPGDVAIATDSIQVVVNGEARQVAVTDGKAIIREVFTERR